MLIIFQKLISSHQLDYMSSSECLLVWRMWPNPPVSNGHGMSEFRVGLRLHWQHLGSQQRHQHTYASPSSAVFQRLPEYRLTPRANSVATAPIFLAITLSFLGITHTSSAPLQYLIRWTPSLSSTSLCPVKVCLIRWHGLFLPQVYASCSTNNVGTLWGVGMQTPHEFGIQWW